VRLKTLINSLPSPSVILIVGRRGSGKDVTAHGTARILSREHKKIIYIDLHPKKYNLPSYFKRFTGKFVPYSILLLSDAHLSLYSREWRTDFNKTMDKLQTISRHRDIDIIYTTQQTRRLDINIVAGVDCIIFKEPSMMAAEFERPEIRKMTETAQLWFKDRSQKTKWGRAVAFTQQGEHRIEYITKPYYWSEELSKAYGKEFEAKPKQPTTTVKI